MIHLIEAAGNFARRAGRYAYPRAGRNAPPGVQAAIEAFHALPEEVKARTPLLWYLLGSGTPAYKMGGAEAEYAATSPVKGQTCANCRHSYKHVTSDTYICDQIAPAIAPPAWCRLWKPAMGKRTEYGRVNGADTDPGTI